MNKFKWLLILLLPAPVLAADFHGYTCTKDCSGHKAGYEWAQRKGVTDTSECGGNSNSFKEGCFAWAKEQEDTQKVDDPAEENSPKPAPVLR